MLPGCISGNTKILYFFNCLLDGMHTTIPYICDFSRGGLNTRLHTLVSKPCSEATNIGDRLSLLADCGCWYKIRIQLTVECDFTINMLGYLYRKQVSKYKFGNKYYHFMGA